MAIELGYNIGKSEELIKSISDNFNALGAYIASSWNHLQPVMRTEWIGPDEIAFEARLVTRVNELYSKSRDLAQAAVTTVVNLTNSWIDFQHTNVIQNEAGTANVSATSGLKHIEDPGLLPKLGVQITAIEWQGKTFTTNDDLGLREASSKSRIIWAVDKFVKDIQSRTIDSFDEITLNNAFFGTQQASLKKYIEEVGKAVGVVTTSVQDLGNALDQLAQSNYATADQTVEEKFTTETTNLSQSVDEKIETRWTSSN